MQAQECRRQPRRQLGYPYRVDTSPAFGQADLTNCEREQIHLAGSIQPHGVLLVLRERDALVVQASANCAAFLGIAADRLLGQTLQALGGDLAAQVQALALLPDLAEPRPLQAHTRGAGGRRAWSGMLHRVPGQGVLALELQAAEPGAEPGPEGTDQAPGAAGLMACLAEAVQAFGQAASITALCDSLVRSVRQLTGHDRVMVYKFDPDGHGKIIAEARAPVLDSLLGHQYPSTDIPQRARALYLANRVRVLVDVHYQPVPLVPALLPGDAHASANAGANAGRPEATDLDMSMCTLRSMSPLHLQYLKNMGVTGTLVVSLVREGRLWGLVAAHHYSARAVSAAQRSACDLLAEVAATRIAAIENYAHAQVAMLVRRLEQRLVEATSTEGDWRLALFRNPRTLLQPLEATGAALFHDGELLTTGEVPSTPELRSLLAWVDAGNAGAPFATNAVSKVAPTLASLTPLASGVLAVKLSQQRPDYLMWFRKEQLHSVTWAGDPSKPMVDNDPRLLVAEHQLAGVRATVQRSHEPVAIADGSGRMLFANPAFATLLGQAAPTLDTLAQAFTQPAQLLTGLEAVRSLHQSWRGELVLGQRDGGRAEPLPVGVRIELVPGRDAQALGYILVLRDLSDNHRAAAARHHLEDALQQAGGARHEGSGALGADAVIGAILTNASLAAMDIADSGSGPGVAPLLEEVEASAQRAAALYSRIRQQLGA